MIVWAGLRNKTDIETMKPATTPSRSYCRFNIDTKYDFSYIPHVKKRCLISLLALSALLVSCLSWVMEKPSFIVRDITIRPRSFSEINLLIGLDIQNPNRFDLTLESFEYTIYLNNEKFGDGALEKEVLLRSSSVTQARLPVLAKLRELENLKTVLSGKDLPYKIAGQAKVKTAVGHFDFPFSQEGQINLRKLFTL